MLPLVKPHFYMLVFVWINHKRYRIRQISVAAANAVSSLYAELNQAAGFSFIFTYSYWFSSLSLGKKVNKHISLIVKILL